MVGHKQKRIERELQEVETLQVTQKLEPQPEEAARAKKRERRLRLFRG